MAELLDPRSGPVKPLDGALQRAHHRLPPDLLPIAAEMPRFTAHGTVLRCPGEANHPHRLAGRPAARARDPRDGERESAAARRERPERHLARCLLAHRTVALERLAAHAEKLL